MNTKSLVSIATGAFTKRLEREFEGDYTLQFHLAPPLFAKRDPITGELHKRAYGPWMMKTFTLLAKFKWLRGSALDIFGYSQERRTERQLIKDYEAIIDELLAALNTDNYDLAVAIASLPEQIRGFGHVKERHLAQVKTKREQLLQAFRQNGTQRVAA